MAHIFGSGDKVHVGHVTMSLKTAATNVTLVLLIVPGSIEQNLCKVRSMIRVFKCKLDLFKYNFFFRRVFVRCHTLTEKDHTA